MTKITATGRARRATNKAEAEKELEELDAYGYEVHKFLDYHWRVRHTDTDFEVDVWPTTKKVMDRETWKTEKYENLLEAIQRLFKDHL